MEGKMRISEATIRSIVRRKLLEAAGSGDAEAGPGSIPPYDSESNMQSFLNQLGDGSSIVFNGTKWFVKESGKFKCVKPDGSPGFNIGEEGEIQETASVASTIFNLPTDLRYRLVIYNSNNDANRKKLSVSSAAAETEKAPAAAPVVKPAAPGLSQEALAKWQKEVSARPLQLGSKGPNVGILQDLLINALNAIPSSFTLGPEGAAVRAQFNQLVKPGKDGTRPSAPGAKYKGDPRISLSQDADYNTLSNIAGALAFSLSRDNDFGPVTRVSVYLFQQFENQQSGNLQPDGRVGKYTAAALMKYAKTS